MSTLKNGIDSVLRLLGHFLTSYQELLPTDMKNDLVSEYYPTRLCYVRPSQDVKSE